MTGGGPAGGPGVPRMRESDLLSRIYAGSRDLEAAFPHVVAGPGHDCAVVATPGGECLLLKVDQLVAGRHFRPHPHTPLDLIARKAIARAVSDIAACGGRPRAALAAATLPPDFGEAPGLFEAMARWARHWGCPLVGGDLVMLSAGQQGPLVLSVSVQGVPHAARGPVLRSGAGRGDAVYVTGALGGSLDRATGLGHHLTFEPRLEEARWLCDTLGDDLHAMMDVSDGLGRDGGRLAAASGVRLRLESGRLPRSPGVREWRAAASEGEDYELLFAAAEGARVPDRCPATGTPITLIGRAEAGTGCVIVAGDGTEVDASGMGWDYAAI
ncbi:MAG: thiamine-phosphate kinase [Phycisphaerales bacterium]